MVRVVVLRVVIPLEFVKIEESDKKKLGIVVTSVPDYLQKLNQNLIVEV
jgi:hypothetical protein